MSSKVTSIWDSASEESEAEDASEEVVEDTENKDKGTDKKQESADAQTPTERNIIEKEIELPEDYKNLQKDRNKIFRIAKNSGARIYFPKVSDEKKCIRLTGKNLKSLDSAVMKISSVVGLVSNAAGSSAKHAKRAPKAQLTHFISIPFNIPLVQDRLRMFKLEVTSTIPEIDERLFQVPEKIHLTLAMLSLPDEEKQNQAKELLKSCQRIIDPLVKPVTADISELGFFGRNEQKARVVFGKITGKRQADIQLLADEFTREFTEKGLAPKLDYTPEDGHVKLHVTVMNNTFRERIAMRQANKEDDPSEPQKKKQNWKQQRDARRSIPPFFDTKEILESFSGRFNLGEDIPVKEIHISSLSQFGDDGFYLPLDKIKLA